jgi:DNA modification methylase
MFRLDILDFKKLILSDIIWKKINRLNSRNNGYIYGICSIIKLVLFLDYIRFGFQLINQKLFEMKI